MHPPDAGTLDGGAYSLTGGSWRTAATPGDIPAVSAWGMVGMALLILAAGTLVYTRRSDSLGIVRFLFVRSVACFPQQAENRNGRVGQTLPEDQALALGETVLAVPSVGVR